MARCYRCEATEPLADIPVGAVHQLCVSCKVSINEWFWTEVANG